eukprot:2335776-Amphidinium_carterae.1
MAPFGTASAAKFSSPPKIPKRHELSSMTRRESTGTVALKPCSSAPRPISQLMRLYLKVDRRSSPQFPLFDPFARARACERHPDEHGDDEDCFM